MNRSLRWGRFVPFIVVAGGLLYATQIVLQIVFGTPSDFGDPLLVAILALALGIWGGIGWLIAVRRPENPISLLMGGEACLMAVASVTSYVGGQWPGTETAALFNNMQGMLVPGLLAVPLLALIFPTGYPMTRRWNVVLWLMVVSVLAGVVGLGLAPTDNSSWSPLASTLTSIAGLTGISAAFLSIAACVVRFRRSRGDERQQMRWLALVALFGGAFFLTLLVSSVFDPSQENPVANTMWVLLMLTITLALPAAVGIAVLRYRLYDIDVVIKKTLVALVLALIIGVLGVGAFALVSQVALWEATPKAASVVIGLVLGALLVPLLRLSRRIADRLVYGKRATPYEVLASFSSRVGEAYSSDDVLPRMAQILQAGTGAASARVLVRVGGDLQEAAATGDPTGREHLESIVFQGEDVGALAVTFPANDPIDQPREQLIAHLASQAGPVVRNVRLIEELRASRQRLVAAQDEERRKLERNIHDGIQQQLVALNVQLGLLGKLIERDATKAGSMTGELQVRATEALEDLRDLARGIYPPLLADKGLGAALEAQARKAAVPTSVHTDGIGRFDQAVESAVYFCSMEALNNIAKYAQATAATVRLELTDGHLTFTVTDNGKGFDTLATSYGTGLQGMADRLDAIGGTLNVTSALGAGTSVTGTVRIGDGS